MTKDNEAHIINELQQGDKNAFKSFYLKYYKLFRSFADNFDLSSDILDDVVQESFIKYWERCEQFASIEMIKGYLYSTIRNQCINHLKHKQVRVKHVDAQLKEMTSHEFFYDKIVKEEVHAELYEQIETLGTKAKQVLYLSLKGLKNEEIASQLEIGTETVKTHKKRAYKILRSKLKNIRLIISFLSV
ncbi:RNA polymerase sigma factor [Carboxylicivirga marina]|uniref:Sigma-70 family RNA polymerase sigma factor n=1 Tax=Carboxylicivirga marina TaxID=2800988 RepID=A0ABS1HKK5_9BACT|nr:sigma-70 family RNA polymerase sigma factor [Carboxylicivirga marina]MBK3518207.1 sigma-70 family RNA polymerase sigma factor [Carboxylicivirga marina]